MKENFHHFYFKLNKQENNNEFDIILNRPVNRICTTQCIIPNVAENVTENNNIFMLVGLNNADEVLAEEEITLTPGIYNATTFENEFNAEILNNVDVANFGELTMTNSGGRFIINHDSNGKTNAELTKISLYTNNENLQEILGLDNDTLDIEFDIDTNFPELFDLSQPQYEIHCNLINNRNNDNNSNDILECIHPVNTDINKYIYFENNFDMDFKVKYLLETYIGEIRIVFRISDQYNNEIDLQGINSEIHCILFYEDENEEKNYFKKSLEYFNRYFEKTN